MTNNTNAALTGESILTMEKNFDKIEQKIRQVALKSQPKKSIISWLAESELLIKLEKINKELGIDYKTIVEICNKEGVEIDGVVRRFPITVQQIYSANVLRKKNEAKRNKLAKKEKINKEKAASRSISKTDAQIAKTNSDGAPTKLSESNQLTHTNKQSNVTPNAPMNQPRVMTSVNRPTQ